MAFDEASNPRSALSSYIRHKLEYSFTRPYGSKVWANEVIHGSRSLGKELTEILQKWEQEKIAQIQNWINNGELLPIEPRYLLYMIWATTQHFADFETQIRALNKGKPLSKVQQERVIENVTNILLRGVGIEP